MYFQIKALLAILFGGTGMYFQIKAMLSLTDRENPKRTPQRLQGGLHVRMGRRSREGRII